LSRFFGGFSPCELLGLPASDGFTPSGAAAAAAKPFDSTELVARIHALARRPGVASSAGLGSGDLTMDSRRRVVNRAGRTLTLAPKEFAVLECLLAADGRPVPAEELLRRVRDEAADPFTLHGTWEKVGSGTRRSRASSCAARASGSADRRIRLARVAGTRSLIVALTCRNYALRSVAGVGFEPT
jgi:Transcriptional regulatory protein, C terminal